MRISPVSLYSLAGVFQAAGSSGAATLAPFFMKFHGYPVALVGIPLVINGVGRICSDLLSGMLAARFGSGILLVTAVSIALAAGAIGVLFRDVMPVFLSLWAVLGLTEAMFGLSLRQIAFDHSATHQQGRAQGRVAAAVGVGFTIGPVLAGFAGSRWGPDVLLLLYALPQSVALALVIMAGGHRIGTPAKEGKLAFWGAGKELLSRPSFLAVCLAIFQTFLFLIGVTRVAFPFLAIRRGLSLDIVGTIVGLSRLADTCGRLVGGWLSDRIGSQRVILTGIVIGVPMFVAETYGWNILTLLIPLSFMTMGFGFTNVASTTFALQSAGPRNKGIALGLARASNSVGTALGPLVSGLLIQTLGYEGGFFAMGLFSVAVSLAVWYGVKDTSRPSKWILTQACLQSHEASLLSSEALLVEDTLPNAAQCA
ncbi:MAG: MFS transporter [Deltaproteobacteria bacterium]|nr:MFS transporter [Deltaproteobacteria bacterium]